MLSWGHVQDRSGNGNTNQFPINFKYTFPVSTLTGLSILTDWLFTIAALFVTSDPKHKK